MYSKLFDNGSRRFFKVFSFPGSGIAGVFFASILLLAIPAVTHAAEFYVDPDYPGTGNGSMSAPWKSLDGSATSAWSAINAALTSSDVTVYFSAREAASDTDESSTKRISIRRTDSSSHRLTLDGMSKYNKNDSSPLWASYSGKSRYKITGDSYSIESTFGPPKRSYVTIRGFKCIAGSSKALSYWGGDYVVVEHNEFSGTSGSAGSLVFFEYAHRVDPNDLRQNGGCRDITFRNNIVHDTVGEGIYIGGSSDTGLPAHSKITFENNTIYNVGIYGGEGDGIDIKDGNSDILVRNNVIRNGTVAGIMSHAPIRAENNVVYEMGNVGIKLNTYWGRGYSDVYMVGNLVFNNKSHGIHIYTQNASRPINNITLDHNTAVKNAAGGIVVESSYAGAISKVIVKNNISASNATGLRLYQVAGATVANNDIYSNTSADYSGISSQKGINGNLSVDPVFLNVNSPAGLDSRFWSSDDGLQLAANSPLRYASELGAAIGAYFLLPPNNLAVRN